jgi:hypothetical protein
VRAADGLARRLDDRGGVANAISASAGHHGHGSPRGDGSDNLVAGTLNSGGNDGGFRTEPGEHLIAFDPTTSLDQAPNRESYPPLKRGSTLDSIGWAPAIAGVTGRSVTDDPLLPLGLDAARYRCCGNGVVAPVAEWLGARLAEALA